MEQWFCFSCHGVFGELEAFPIVRPTRDGDEDIDGYLCPFCRSDEITTVGDDHDFAG